MSPCAVAQADENLNRLENYSRPAEPSDPKNTATIYFRHFISDSTVSYLAKVRPYRGPGDSWQGTICESTQDPKCTSSSWKWEYQSLYPKCLSDDETNCIVAVWAIDENGDKTFGELSKYLNYGNEFLGDPKLNIPAGKSTSIWKFPKLKGQETTTFAVQVGEHGGEVAESSIDRWGMLGYPFDFFARIQPVKLGEISWNQQLEPARNRTDQDGNLYVDFGQAQQTCIGFEKGVCGTPQTFDVNQRFGIKFRTSNHLQPFFQGRLTLPNLTVIDLPNESHEITLEANPAQISLMEGRADFSDIIQSCKFFPYSQWSTPISFYDRWNTLSWSNGDSGDGVFEMYNCWKKWIDDKAVGEQTRWTFISTNSSDSPELLSCTRNVPISILVSTNSAIYSDGPPTWDSKNQSLQYRVAGPHFLSNGSLNRGTYSLILNSQVAKCLYGLESTGLQATVEVVSDLGNTTTTTTSVNSINGYLNLSAQNFTFSAPTIKIKLSQNTQSTNPDLTPTIAQPTTSGKINTKKVILTITCTRGKTIKKVSGISPVCPAGYKKR